MAQARRRPPTSPSAPAAGAWIVNVSAAEGKDRNTLIAVTPFQFTDYPGGEGAADLAATEFNPLLACVSSGGMQP